MNAATRLVYPGAASLGRKTLHRLMNDLVGTWEEGGVQEFIIITAHGQDPHQEALSTLSTIRATVRTVDILSISFDQAAGHEVPIHGGELDTSLLLYVAPELAALDRAEDYFPSRRSVRRYRRGSRSAIPADSPGSLGAPTRATMETGQRAYELIYERLATRLFHRPTTSTLQERREPTA